ncbi:MAG TPA: hypothetical protein VLL98_04600 [Rickettsiales bacterium]|nr:hypothetical protein [Rickettsiales bacterium]
MKKVIIINLGSKGVILSLKSGNVISDQAFFEGLNQDTIENINKFFFKYKKYDSYIVLDTVAQNYNYKIFPDLNYFDLNRIAGRRFENEIPKSDLKYKKFLYKNRVDQKSVFLFVSASIDSPLKEWIEYFETLENNLLGIYLMPLEIVEATKKLMLSVGAKEFIKEKNKWILITFNNKVSDLRQVVIYNNNLAFTRLISVEVSNNETNHGDLSEHIKNDIIRTSEYIRRFDSNFTFDNLAIITSIPDEEKVRVKDLKVEDAKVFSFSPYEIAKALKIEKGFDRDEIFTDQILGFFIMNNKNRVRLGNKIINTIFNLTIFSYIFKKFIWLFFLICIITGIIVGIMDFKYNTIISSLTKQLIDNKEILQNKSKQEFGMETKDVDKIIDIGSVKDVIDTNFKNPKKSFEKFYLAEDDAGLVYELKWVMNNFEYENISNKMNIKITYNMSLLNSEGDVNKLLLKYKELNARLKNIYKSDLIFIDIMPTNMDFNKNYFTYPIKIEVIEKN